MMMNRVRGTLLFLCGACACYTSYTMAQQAFNINGTKTITASSIDLGTWQVVATAPDNTEISFVTKLKAAKNSNNTVVGTVLSVGTGNKTWGIRKQHLQNTRSGARYIDEGIASYDMAIRSYVFDCKNSALMPLDTTYFAKSVNIYGENHRLENEGMRKQFGYYPFQFIAPPSTNYYALQYYCK